MSNKTLGVITCPIHVFTKTVGSDMSPLRLVILGSVDDVSKLHFCHFLEVTCSIHMSTKYVPDFMSDDVSRSHILQLFCGLQNVVGDSYVM